MNTLFTDGTSSFSCASTGQFVNIAGVEKEQSTAKVLPKAPTRKSRYGNHGVKKARRFKISSIKQIATKGSPKDLSKRARYSKQPCSKNKKRFIIPFLDQIATNLSALLIKQIPSISPAPSTPPNLTMSPSTSNTPKIPNTPTSPNSSIPPSPPKPPTSPFSSTPSIPLPSTSKILSWLSTALKVLLLFVLVEFINAQTQTIVQFQYIDFRLLYVVIIGSMFGILPGFFAGGLACLAVVNGFEFLNVHWPTLLFNIQNWLPFAGYLLAGLITGYLCNKRVEDQKVAQAQLDEAVKKLQATEELYEKSIADKEQLSHQVISCNDSLGKTISIVRSLDSPFSEIVLIRALSVFEKVLDNQSIALYTTDIDHKHVYFHSCSKPFLEHLTHAISLDTSNCFWTNLKENDIWVNRDYIEGCPDYCITLNVNNKYHVVIMICDAKPSQMATYFTNQIKVLGDLVQDSLNRSTRYLEQVKDQMYMPDTRILKHPWFMNILMAKQDQHKQGVAEHVLLQVTCPGHVTLKQAQDRMVPHIQPGDALGIGPEGDFFVILSRMKSKEIAATQYALTKTGLLIEQRQTLEHSEEDETWTSLSLGA